MSEQPFEDVQSHFKITMPPGLPAAVQTHSVWGAYEIEQERKEIAARQALAMRQEMALLKSERNYYRNWAYSLLLFWVITLAAFVVSLFIR